MNSIVNVRYGLNYINPVETSYQLIDRSINIIINPVFNDVNTIRVLLPDSKGDYVRDFIIKILVPDQSNYTIDINDGIYYSDDSDIFKLNSGLNIIAITEIGDNEFMISKKIISLINK